MLDSERSCSGELFPASLEHALRLAARWHDGQCRKGSPQPYVVHPLAVAVILARLGFDEPVVVASVLHDTLEDTGASYADLAREFGTRVADLVSAASEVKTGPAGQRLPWQVRKHEHLDRLLAFPDSTARALVLADKLHNLRSLVYDFEREGDVAWSRMSVDRGEWIAHHRRAINALALESPDARIERLAVECLDCLSILAEGQAPGQ